MTERTPNDLTNIQCLESHPIFSQPANGSNHEMSRLFNLFSVNGGCHETDRNESGTKPTEPTEPTATELAQPWLGPARVCKLLKSYPMTSARSWVCTDRSAPSNQCGRSARGLKISPMDLKCAAIVMKTSQVRPTRRSTNPCVTDRHDRVRL